MASQDVSAVTGACMVFRRSVFAELRGFDEVFSVDYNDIDFCMRARGHGYRVVWAANAELYHLESATRGAGHEQIKHDRFERETARFREKWRHVLNDDPYYNPNLSLAVTDRSLAAAPRIKRPWRLHELRRTEVSPKVDS
jgi:GT2 family glycosyltransferase